MYNILLKTFLLAACVKIANCRDLVCNSGTDQQCRRCHYDYGGEKKAFRRASSGGHTNRICQSKYTLYVNNTFQAEFILFVKMFVKLVDNNVHQVGR